jgi:hypothetical protein
MSSATSLDNLLAQMHQNNEVLNGWDAVMNLLESSVNDFFQKQWEKQSNNAGAMKISLIWCDGVNPFKGEYFTNVVQFDVELAQPLFQFESGQNSVKVSQDIRGATLKKGTMTVPSSFNPQNCGCQPNDPKVEWTPSISIDTTSKPSVSGTVTLGQVQGLVANSRSLVLDFAKGAFDLNHLTVQGVKNSDIVNQLKDWFATNKITYILASLDFQNLANLPALTPTAFEFAVTKTNAGNTIVQLLMTTNGKQPTDNSILVTEPIPTADGLTCSLMISSRILYQDILVAGINQGNRPFKLQASAPTAAGQCWSAAISPAMVFSGEFSFGSCCNRTTVSYSVPLGGKFTGSETTGFSLSQQQGDQSIQISLSANYAVQLSGSGPDQEIAIVPGTPTVTVTGGAESECKSQLEQFLNNDLKNAVAGISCAPIKYMALKNLLFPGNLIKMHQLQVPGDLLIVGTFDPA